MEIKAIRNQYNEEKSFILKIVGELKMANTPAYLYLFNFNSQSCKILLFFHYFIYM